MPREIGIGLLGLGTVGAAVARTLHQRRDYLQRQLGRTFAVRRALVRNPGKARDIPFGPEILTTDAADILDADDIEIVVELLGGVDPAHAYLRRAIDAGKHIVTANKEVMAAHGAELREQAADRDLDLYFEASVGGGIPLIGPFRQDLMANEIREVHAILNGTTNYILTEMAAGEKDYATALAEAQALGYAEPDPTNDVEGHDAASKLAILAALAFKCRIPIAAVYREGITKLAAADFRYAAELGYAIKLLAIAKRRPAGVEVRVHPAFVQTDFLIGQVDGVFNAVRIDGDLLGRALFVGRGAGPEPTSSAIVADLIDLGHNIAAGSHNRIPIMVDGSIKPLPMDDVLSRHYLRLWVNDQPGVLAQIGAICGEEQISIASVLQKEVDEDARRAELVLLTREAVESSLRRAVARIGELDVVSEVASVIRVEDLTE
jgi:homoserine dehydrogenase